MVARHRTRRSPVLVGQQALDGGADAPEVPELDETIFAAGDYTKGLVWVVVQVPHGVAVRIRDGRRDSAWDTRYTSR